jgi:hypothetical protein
MQSALPFNDYYYDSSPQMTTLPPSRTPFSALSATGLPAFSDYEKVLAGHGDGQIDFEEYMLSPFNLELFREHQINASQVTELANLISERGLPDFPIVFCNLPNAEGKVYLEGEIPWPLIFIDSQKFGDQDELRQVYLHEAAHLVANDQDHDFSFAAINTLFRSYAGYPQSQREYDYRSCESIELTIPEAKALSIEMAEYATERGVPVSRAAEAILMLIGSNLHVRNNGQTIVQSFGRVLDVLENTSKL